jgi:hypothetical protein
MAQSYESSTVDTSRVLAYARKVAMVANGSVPAIHCDGQTGWILGWIVEGAARGGPLNDNWDEGTLVFLDTSGGLWSGQFWVSVPAEPVTGARNLEPMTQDYDMVRLDRRNTAQFRRVRSYDGTSSRSEKGTCMELTVHAKGVGLSRALKRLHSRAGG